MKKKRFHFFSIKLFFIFVMRKITRLIGIPRAGTGLHRRIDITMYKWCTSFIKKKNANIMEKYAQIDEFIPPYPVAGEEGKIWTMWWQGEENAPLLIKRCLESIRKNAGSHEVVVIDENNFSNYLELPSYIIEKHKSGIMPTVKLSNIIRMGLLAEYGGLWLDATMYCFNVIPNTIWNMPIFSLKSYMEIPTCIFADLMHDNHIYPFEDFAIGGVKGHPFFCFVRDVLIQHWAKYSSTPIYNLLLLTMKLGYTTIPLAKRDIDAIPVNCNDARMLQSIFNKKYDVDAVNAVASDITPFFKHNRHAHLHGWYSEYTDAGEETVFKRFLEGTLV